MAEDLARIKTNVQKMVEQGAPETDIDAYIASEGVSLDEVRDYQPQTMGMAEDVVTQFGKNFNKGLYETVNLPTTLGNLAMGGVDALPGVDAPFRFKRPVEAIAPQVDETIMNPPPAQTAGGRFAGTIGEFAGANALPAMGVVAAAPRLAAQTANATTSMGRMANQFFAPVAAAPGRAAAGEVLSTIGAGTGAQIARDVAPGNPTAEFLAATAGGIGAPLAAGISPANLARKGASWTFGKMSPKATEKRAREALVDALRKNITPEGRSNIGETEEIRKAIPGYKPSVAEATESPSLVATQRQFEVGLGGPELDAAIGRYGENAAAIDRARAFDAPRTATSLEDELFAQRLRLNKDIESIDAADRGVVQKSGELAESIPSGSRKRDVGAQLRNELLTERERIKEEMSLSAREMGLNDTTARLPFGEYKQQLKDAVAPRSKMDDRSVLPSGILADIDAMDDSASIVDMMALRSRIDADLREAQRTPSGQKRVPSLTALKSEVDAVTDGMIKRINDPELADNLQQFRQMYREDYIMPFETGASGRLLKKDATGSYRVADENVAAEYFSGWNQTAADQFNKAFKNAPSANAAMEAAALDDLYNSALRDGALDPNLVASWARKNKGVLEAFPGISKRVGNIGSTLDSLTARRATLADRKRQVEQSYLARELGRLENAMGSVTPEGMVNDAIRNPKRMERLLTAVKSDEGRSAISRQVWDTALDAKSPVKYLMDNQVSLRAAMGDKFDTAMKLARAIEKNSLVPRPSGQAIDTNPVAGLEGILGTGLNQISSRVFAVKSGRTSARYALADIAGRAFRTMTSDQARKTLQEALYDPEAATALIDAIGSGTMTEPQAKRLYTFLLGNGIVALNSSQAAGDEEALVDAMAAQPR